MITVKIFAVERRELGLTLEAKMNFSFTRSEVCWSTSSEVKGTELSFTWNKLCIANHTSYRHMAIIARPYPYSFLFGPYQCRRGGAAIIHTLEIKVGLVDIEQLRGTH